MSSTNSFHIDKTFTSVTLIGGKGCNEQKPDLVVFGGARFHKCVELSDTAIGGNLVVDGSLTVFETAAFGNIEADNLLINTLTANTITTHTTTTDTLFVNDDSVFCGNVLIKGSLTVLTGNATVVGNCIIANDQLAHVCALNGDMIELVGDSNFYGDTMMYGNLDLDCGILSNVMDLYVHGLHGKSPIDVYDNLNILDTMDGGRITFVGGVQIGDLTTTAADASSLAIGPGATALAGNSVVVGPGSTDNGQSNVIVLGSGVTALDVTSGNQLVLGSGISALAGAVVLTSYIQVNIGGTVYKIPIGI